jgi:hypothetical protein
MHEDAEDPPSTIGDSKRFSGRPAQRRHCQEINAKEHREEVYFRTADFLGGAVFFRGALFGVGGLRASLTALPAWNRTALLAAIWIASPVRVFRPSRAGRAATLFSRGGHW